MSLFSDMSLFSRLVCALTALSTTWYCGITCGAVENCIISTERRDQSGKYRCTPFNIIRKVLYRYRLLLLFGSPSVSSFAVPQLTFRLGKVVGALKGTFRLLPHFAYRV